VKLLELGDGLEVQRSRKLVRLEEACIVVVADEMMVTNNDHYESAFFSKSEILFQKPNFASSVSAKRPQGSRFARG
jgi:hypothetical protein